MMDLLARTGRQRQRYEGEFRLVAGCIPYRLKENADNCVDDLENRLEVLMISSPDRDDLVFPKGGWEDDETVEAAACREALEEAGVEGTLDSKELGTWEFRSKSRQNCCGMEGYCRGVMFALEVTKEYEFWPEKSSHERRWVSVSEAFKLCRYGWMQEALQAFLSNLSEKEKRRAFLSFLSEEKGQEVREDDAGLEVADDQMSYLSEESNGQEAREDDAGLDVADDQMSYLSEESNGPAREDDVVLEVADDQMSYLSEGYNGQATEDVVLEVADHPIRSTICCVKSSFETQRLDDTYDCVVLG